ncbi:MAG: phosphate ABC transporter permease PstA [candidate division WOR-3 bacterium]
MTKSGLLLKKLADRAGTGVVILSATLIALVLGYIFSFITLKGAGVLSWDFLTKPPMNNMTEGGIFPAIVGTFYLAVISTIASFPIGLGAGIYLAEYASDNWFTRLIRSTTRNLGGIPSIVYGIFGVALFVQLSRMGTSLLASGLTLGLMNLPWLITTSEEALRQVPHSYREGSLALGATKWQTIWKAVLPAALPGILTGMILSMSRAMGETAPILFTGVVFYTPHLPTSPTSQFMALPYHLYILATQHQNIEGVRPLAYGTALVLVILTFILNLAAFFIRKRFSPKA